MEIRYPLQHRAKGMPWNNLAKKNYAKLTILNMQ